MSGEREVGSIAVILNHSGNMEARADGGCVIDKFQDVPALNVFTASGSDPISSLCVKDGNNFIE
jgi:hypothetical protein